MQLEKVVAYHKALADPTRIRMLILLADGERNGLELAERLSLAPATITIMPPSSGKPGSSGSGGRRMRFIFR